MPLHAQLKPIKEFTFPSGSPHLLEMFGGVYANPDDVGNPLIECFLTPCEPRPDGQAGFIRRISEQVRVGVGVGNLTNLHIGRCVQDGSFVPPPPHFGRNTEEITFEFDSADRQALQEIFLDALGLEPQTSPISLRLQRTDVKCPLKVVTGNVVGTTRLFATGGPSESRPWKTKVCFHELELIRFYYTNSSSLCRAVFSDAFTEENIGKAVFAEEPWVSFDDEADEHFFVHRQGFSEADMPILGRILCEPNALALKGIRRIHQSLLASRLSLMRPDNVGYPRTAFPFAQRTRLSLTGHRVRQTDGEFLFVVHHINACSSAFPFRRLSYASIRPTAVVDKEMAAPAETGRHRPQRLTGPANTTLDAQGFNRSDMAPSADSIAVSREVGTRIFSGLAKVTLRRDHHYVTIPPRKPNIPSTDAFLKDWSTGKPRSGSSTAVKLHQADRLESKPLAADLETFIEVMKELAALQPSWQLESRAIGALPWRSDGSDVWRGFFPLVPCAVRRTVMYRFSFVVNASSERRQVVCFEIFANTQHFYLLEAQRRMRHDAQGQLAEYKDMLPILLISRHDRGSMSPASLSEILVDTVSNPSKTWPTAVNGCFREVVEHGHGADTVAKLSLRLAKAVQRQIYRNPEA